MAITSTEIHLMLSGNLATNIDPNDSFGGQISTATGGKIVSGAMNNDMDDITSQEASDGITIYHAYYYKNTNNSSPSPLEYINPAFYIQTNTVVTDTEVYIGLPPQAKNTTVERLTAETGSGAATPPVTPPVSVTFSSAPANFASGLALGSLLATEYRGIWVKYVVNSSASAVLDTYTLGIQGDSNP